MKLYELTYLLSLKLTEDEVKNFSEKITSFIKEAGGIPEESSLRGKITKKRLASQIKKEGEAYLGTIIFYLPSQEIEKLKKELNTGKQILRYTIITKKLLKEVKRPRTLLKISKTEENPKSSPEKADLKEIEKKLEEILEK